MFYSTQYVGCDYPYQQVVPNVPTVMYIGNNLHKQRFASIKYLLKNIIELFLPSFKEVYLSLRSLLRNFKLTELMLAFMLCIFGQITNIFIS